MMPSFSRFGVYSIDFPSPPSKLSPFSEKLEMAMKDIFGMMYGAVGKSGLTVACCSY